MDSKSIQCGFESHRGHNLSSCLLPQHGPGREHERSIVLADWQREIVAAHPGDFVRGLFHSDGCRVANRVNRRNSLSVARRAAVALLDRHVGPKS